jgi:mono/diheme cytochrome c family protein
MARLLVRGLLLGLALLATAAAAVAWLDRMPATWVSAANSPPSTPVNLAATAADVQRGATLARAGNCQHCHTSRGGEPLAGGRAVGTPFGAVYSANLTPHVSTGLGQWTAGDFWNSLHHGRSASGRRLVPACPYTSFTHITRADSDLLFAWLQQQPAVARANTPHTLRWPYGTQPALALWRTLFFSLNPATTWVPNPQRSAQWNRGAYLVQGAGHCVACHGARNAWGGVNTESVMTANAAIPGAEASAGQVLPSGWYAPSLQRLDGASVAQWPLASTVALLQTGQSPHGVASGPMAAVVQHSTQWLPPDDLLAMAVYLQSLPTVAAAAKPNATTAEAQRVTNGQTLYADHCASCHGAQGQGGRTAAGLLVYPALAGNRLVLMDPPNNLVRVLALGGFGAATAGHPQPYGMPPFGAVLADTQLADVATYLRQAWGGQASAVSALQVQRLRGSGTE